MSSPALRALWIDEQNDPNYALDREYAITTVCRSARDPRTTPGALATDRARGFGTCLYRAASWTDVATGGAAFADLCSADLTRLAPGSQANDPRYCADVEKASFQTASAWIKFVSDFLLRFRQHRPSRVLDWTLEGFQGGNFDAAFVSAVIRSNANVVPQGYTATMEAFALDRVVLDLIGVGVPAARVMTFSDAAALPKLATSRWQGYAFTQGRLRP